MTEDREIIAHPTNEHLRVRVRIDYSPSQPYNDGGFPLWRIERGRYTDASRAVQETAITSYVTPAGLDAGLGEALSRWGITHEAVDRYLRIFWGATFVEWWHSGSYWYITCDPAHWRQHLDITDADTRREGYADGALDEWQAWCEGNVWYAIPEREIFVRSTHKTWDLSEGVDPDDPYGPDGEVDVTEHHEWVETEDGAVGGFYGDLDDDMRTNILWQFGWDKQ